MTLHRNCSISIDATGPASKPSWPSGMCGTPASATGPAGRPWRGAIWALPKDMRAASLRLPEADSSWEIAHLSRRANPPVSRRRGCADGFRDQRRDFEDLDPGAKGPGREPERRHGIGDVDLLDGGFLDQLAGAVHEQAMRGGGEDMRGAMRLAGARPGRWCRPC